ncbi:MAG: AAA family ATPase [Clostridia bacterium]|nr:AAA family ATPase [Clostridia bacterium]
MNSIRSVTIENFQSHLKTKLEFVEGLNVIVGPSDQGKSAVIRAIKWVLFNEPRGLEFIRHGASTAKVALEFSNGYTIIRERSKSKNRYSIVDLEGNETHFEGFGNEVPEEVIKAHGIPKVVLDSDIHATLNIADQLEGPFLLSETGAVRAKAIGRLTGLHIIDYSIRDSLADLRRENQTRDRVNSEMDEIDENLGKYKNLDEIKERIDRFEELFETLEAKIQKRLQLEDRKLILDRLDSEQQALEKMTAKLKHLNESELLIKNAEIEINRLNTLNRLNSSIKDLEHGMKQVDKILKLSRGVEQAEGVLQNAVEVKDRMNRLLIVQGSFKKLEKGIQNELNMIQQTEEVENLEGLMRDLKEKLQLREDAMKLSVKAKEWSKEYQAASKVMSGLQNVTEYETIFNEITVKTDTARKLISVQEKYALLQNQIMEGNKYMKQNTEEIKKMAEEYKNRLVALGRCPLCESSIDNMKVEEIMRHYEEVHQ